MQEEINEILNNLKDFSIEHCHHDYDYTFTKKEIELLLDYITNLQKKYENSQITLSEEWKKRLEIEEKNRK